MTEQRRRVAVVGAGPSGLFAAQALANADGVDVHVDLYDRLPTPFGLLRYGVAPDHTSIKGVATALAKVFESPRIAFLGMVELGRDVTRHDLLEAYDAVIYAAGASEDLRMNIPGEDLIGCRSAREFVAWYSGHPDAVEQSLDGVRTAVTIGVGNVAVDVARILAKTADALSVTDMPDAVLDVLRAGRIDDVWIVGRRGPHLASFTTVELRELLNTPGVQPVIHEGTFDGIDEDTLDRRTKANVQALRVAAERDVPDAHTRLHLLFWHRPVAVLGDDRVTALQLERTAPDATGRAVGTGELSSIDCELVLRSIGYRGKTLPDVPFDAERGVIPHTEGRVIDPDGSVHPREYVVGWIKRGPVGVIGTNKSDAAETVAHVLADLAAGEPVTRIRPEEIWARSGVRPSTYADWKRIEQAEIALGRSAGRDRTKIEEWAELTDIARTGRAGGPLIQDDPSPI